MRIRIISAALLFSLCSAWVPIIGVHAEAPTTVVINELMWMGSSASSYDEWIELRNLTSQPIDATNWLLTKKASGAEVPMLNLPAEATIPANGYFLISNYGTDSALTKLGTQPDVVNADVSLVNSALQLKLYDASGQLIDVADDGSGAPLGGAYESGVSWRSMERVFNPGDGAQKTSWRAATTSVNFDAGAAELGTPRAQNGNSAPIPNAGGDIETIVGVSTPFDGTESSDPDNDPLTYTWDFGDQQSGSGPTPTHAYISIGTYQATMTVSDGQEQAIDELTVSVEKEAPSNGVPDQPEQRPTNTNQTPAETRLDNRQTGDMLINELLPNPNGADQAGEFIELYNRGTKPIALDNWTLTDDTKTFTISALTIDGRDYLALPYAMTRMLLRNGGGAIKLIDPFHATKSTVAYPSAKDGQAYARVAFGEQWQWTDLPTPGAENEIQNADVGTSADPNDASTPTAAKNTKTATQDEAPRDIISTDIDDLPARTAVRLSGSVIVPPGAFSSTTFWLADSDGSVEIAFSGRSIPKLSINDSVAVLGNTSSAGIGRRVNLAADGLGVKGSTEAVEPEERELGSLTQDDIGRLVVVEGAVQAVTSRTLTLSDDAGDSMTVSIKRGTGIALTKVKKDAGIQIAGMIGWSGDGPQLWPRQQSDLMILGEVKGASVETTSQPIELSLKKPATTWPVAAVSGLLVIGAAVFYLRQRRAHPAKT